MQQKLEFLFQIDMTLSLEAVNIKHLIQECQVCHVSLLYMYVQHTYCVCLDLLE